jgi:carboxypeptidase C (cathepsin A)
MKWYGQEEYKKALRYTWVTGDKNKDPPSGYSISAKNLTYVLVLHASHMVPYSGKHYAFYAV